MAERRKRVKLVDRVRESSWLRDIREYQKYFSVPPCIESVGMNPIYRNELESELR